MKVTDSCKCGATFTANGMPSNVAQMWATWINAHRACRGDDRLVEVEVSG